MSKYNKRYPAVRLNGKRVEVHRLIAQKALGRPLRGTEQIHHFDENHLNYANNNLVICPDMAYHQLLHKRQRAFAESGNPNLLKCRHCKQYDEPMNLVTIKCKGKHAARSRSYHQACNAAAAKQRSKSRAHAGMVG